MKSTTVSISILFYNLTYVFYLLSVYKPRTLYIDFVSNRFILIDLYKIILETSINFVGHLFKTYFIGKYILT